MKSIYIVGIVLVSIVIAAFTMGFNKGKNVKETFIEEVANYESIVVLELFTSQGCSSCPSADVLLDNVKKQYKKEVFALSYHVDYWDYLGWNDPFAKSKFAKKQRQYNNKFKNNSNYTPQIVVNGKEHFVGSNSSKMYSKIETYKKRKSANNIALKNVVRTKGKVALNYDVEGGLVDKKLKLLLVLDERITVVKRGENRNRTLKNSNIVVAESTTLLKGSEGEASIVIPEIVKPNEKIKLIVVVENSTYDITGAVKSDIKS